MLKKNLVVIVLIIGMIFSVIFPVGVTAGYSMKSAEPVDLLVANGAIKIADFSNLTEDTLMKNIGKVSSGHTLSINTDSAYTMNGSATSLKWDMPANAGSSSYFEIISDYDLSAFEGMQYSVYVQFYGCRPDDNLTYKFNKQIGSDDASGGFNNGDHMWDKFIKNMKI